MSIEKSLTISNILSFRTFPPLPLPLRAHMNSCCTRFSSRCAHILHAIFVYARTSLARDLRLCAHVSCLLHAICVYARAPLARDFRLCAHTSNSLARAFRLGAHISCTRFSSMRAHLLHAMFRLCCANISCSGSGFISRGSSPGVHLPGSSSGLISRPHLPASSPGI